MTNAIEKELSSLKSEDLQKACADLSERYTKGQFIESQLHRKAYIAARLPATYGVISQILNRIEPYLKDIKSFMDLGGGVGSALWAASETIPTLQKTTLFERDVELIRLGQNLTQKNLEPLEISWCREDITKDISLPSHDITLISYVLNELSLEEQTQIVEKAYFSSDKLLILIEPGTPKGYGHILKARDHLIQLGAQIVAPCPHMLPCPLMKAYHEEKDWCHFRVRIPRESYHIMAKQGSLPYEDEKYCYLVVSPHHGPLTTSRIIKAPIRKSGHVILDLCESKGDIQRRVISKRQKNHYANARDADWGDSWEVKPPIDDETEEG